MSDEKLRHTYRRDAHRRLQHFRRHAEVADIQSRRAREAQSWQRSNPEDQSRIGYLMLLPNAIAVWCWPLLIRSGAVPIANSKLGAKNRPGSPNAMASSIPSRMDCEAAAFAQVRSFWPARRVTIAGGRHAHAEGNREDYRQHSSRMT